MPCQYRRDADRNSNPSIKHFGVMMIHHDTLESTKGEKGFSEKHANLVVLGALPPERTACHKLLLGFMTLFRISSGLVWQPCYRLVISKEEGRQKGLETSTSMNFSRSASRLARSSFRFLLSAIKLCFFLSSLCLSCSSDSRSMCSWLMRAIISSSSLSWICSGNRWRNSWTEMSGSCWYLWLQITLASIPCLTVLLHTRKTHTRISRHGDASAHNKDSVIASGGGQPLVGLQL